MGLPVVKKGKDEGSYSQCTSSVRVHCTDLPQQNIPKPA
jgi:hypothetical protein